MKRESIQAVESVKRMECAIKSLSRAAIHSLNALSEFALAMNQIEAIREERKRQRRQFRINWIKYWVLFGWTKKWFESFNSCHAPNLKRIYKALISHKLFKPLLITIIASFLTGVVLVISGAADSFILKCLRFFLN